MNEQEKKNVCLVCGKCAMFKEPYKTNECSIFELISLAEKKARIDELKEHIETLRQIINLDKTPAYGYGKEEQDKNNRGQFSEAGRWKTPREYCQDLLRSKEQALAELEKESEK